MTACITSEVLAADMAQAFELLSLGTVLLFGVPIVLGTLFGFLIFRLFDQSAPCCCRDLDGGSVSDTPTKVWNPILSGQ